LEALALFKITPKRKLVKEELRIVVITKK